MPQAIRGCVSHAATNLSIKLLYKAPLAIAHHGDRQSQLNGLSCMRGTWFYDSLYVEVAFM
jgi:hypothetical protein